ncbi:NAD(P)-dependent oxidoreductase [Bosea sp. (in: a-proteobacteria)]|uniref:NAD(P)-dependent oxidoreductase n=1 Tax=Bosea sp. (in: a-proteobacteria) TaxID=1871050 RepID=UPI002FC95A25
MKALLHFSAGTGLREKLAAIAEPRIVVVEPQDEARFAREIADAEVLLHVLAPVTSAMIAMAPKLRLIQKIGVGVNTIDRAAAARAGIAVANMPGTNTAAVAEHTLALMLATLRRIAALDGATKAGRGWQVGADEAVALGEIGGSRVGFVGYGAVPQRLTPALQALGAEVGFWNRSERPGASAIALPFDELLASSDIVSLHVPLTGGTRQLLDRAAIARLKPGAILINTARGELVDQAALAEALQSGRIAGAGLDVFEREPATELGALAACPTLVTTPHIAWLTPQTLERSLAVARENCRRLQAGEALLHAIAPEAAA